ncbi:CYTH domain-containing protein [Lacticaseibacillus parakribbianus]|uniref:CYTH domain-containing protein n=1 Tax=Lacticaseibacillus parakribbianus TaxID=2970927 RepID=UPI0021CB901E|nr:CYTH domain-containing protein [Lacticaseibacillus parakribbianus]
MHSTEQELKALLTPDQAAAIQAAFAFEAPFTQTNLYFDTPDATLAARHLGLRVRRFADRAEQTLKVPAGPDRRLTEITDPLPQASGLTAGGAVEAALAAQGIAWATLVEVATATTTRRLSRQAAGLLTLDQTCYPNQTQDFELELEVQNFAVGKNFFMMLRQRFGLSDRGLTNKITRALQNNKKL